MKYVLLVSFISVLSCNIGSNEARRDTTIHYETNTTDILKDRGIRLFQQHCAACHSLMRESTGPPLDEKLLRTRSDGWIDTFFNHRKYLRKDKALKARVKSYGHTCPTISLGKNELKQLLAYLRDPFIGCLKR